MTKESVKLITDISIFIIITYRKKMNYDCGPIQFNKFLWYLQIYYWIKYKENILGQSVYMSSWRFGPILPYLWRNYEEILKKSNEIDDSKYNLLWDVNRIKAVEKIINQFSKYTPFQLVNKFHKDFNYLYDLKNGTYKEEEINLLNLDNKIISQISKKYGWDYQEVDDVVKKYSGIPTKYEGEKN